MKTSFLDKAELKSCTLQTDQEQERQANLTFLPPEDVRSGFTDSAFSLLEDLDLLLFSFSADSGESQEGLVLLLFLEESERERFCALD